MSIIFTKKPDYATTLRLDLRGRFDLFELYEGDNYVSTISMPSGSSIDSALQHAKRCNIKVDKATPIKDLEKCK